jgi:hypothetical protein
MQWLVDAGFDTPDLRFTYSIPGHDDGGPGWHRAVVHATTTS